MSHEEILERALRAAVEEINLEDVAEEAGAEPLTDEDGASTEVVEVLTLADAGFMTTDKGVSVRLSDGRQFTIEIKRYR
ncbi:hypothetical protein DDE19_26155 [Micromonospora ureilytica]|uniref:Uncharacterized protein n=1 Tax=Micromonospora ureilytica TaxID=709868 RepID=A0A3N9XK15_9ACTN|nr:hypothetical protein [Micromonospora ureilytica]RQX13425.1 hypothetical protein DDE19_26155 [Micromonospora ureilytica]